MNDQNKQLFKAQATKVIVLSKNLKQNDKERVKERKTQPE